MSPTVNNFVHDLVAMAKAMEDLPQVQAQLEHVRQDNDRLASTVMNREETIQRLKAEIETHLATIRKVEVERDNAEMMFLELDEKAHKVLASVKNAMDQLDQSVTVLDPPKPQPEPIPVAGDPTEDTSALGGATAEPTTAFNDTSSENTSAQGQSATDLTAEPVEQTVSVNTSDDPSIDPGPAIGSAFDDVGYHNEPPLRDKHGSWATWDDWATRMNTRYGQRWPVRIEQI